jgi:hypothetical protein
VFVLPNHFLFRYRLNLVDINLLYSSLFGVKGFYN